MVLAWLLAPRLAAGVPLALVRVANLADMAGRVTVTLRAESATGFDQSKLNNGVLEPLREADLIQ